MKQRVVRTLELLSREQTEIITIASWLIIPNLLTKLVSQVFYSIVASVYGTSHTYSLFLIADALPELVASVLLFGVVGAIVIPILIEAKEKESREDFFETYSTIFNFALLTFGAIALLIIIFADSLMPFILTHLIRPNETLSTDDINLVVSMMRALFLPQVLLGGSVFISSGLNTFNRFLLPQLSPLFYRTGMLIASVILIRTTNGSPWALVGGVYAGALLHLIIQVPLAWKLGLNFRPHLNLRNVYLRKLGRIVTPRLLAYSMEQISNTAVEFIAFSYRFAFTVAQNYATTIINTVPSLFGMAFATASFPTLSKLYQTKRYEEFAQMVINTINQVVFLALPVVITLVILRLPIVRLVYGILPGNFDRESTYLTAWLVLFFGLGVIFSSLRGFAYRIFYAAQNTKLPFFIAVISMVFTILAAIAFSNYFSHFDRYAIRDLYWDPSMFFNKEEGRAAAAGIGLSISLAGALEIFMLLGIFHRRIIKLDWGQLFNRLLNKIIPGSAMAVVMFLMYKLWDGVDALPVDATPNFTGSTTLNLIFLSIITVFTSFMVYYLMCYFLKTEELKIIRKVLNPIFRPIGLEIKR